MSDSDHSNKEQALRMRGEVVEALPNALFRVRIPGGLMVLATLGGKLKVHYIKVLTGDWVEVELSPYNLERGRIVTRYRPEEGRIFAEEEAAARPPTP